MTRELPPYGARSLRRSLAMLEALAAPSELLCARTSPAAELASGLDAALVRGPVLDGLVAALDALGGGTAPPPAAAARRP
ncbi:hypothetical protein BE21_19300, partial [Sorangium cellulosum]